MRPLAAQFARTGAGASGASMIARAAPPRQTGAGAGGAAIARATAPRPLRRSRARCVRAVAGRVQLADLGRPEATGGYFDQVKEDSRRYRRTVSSPGPWSGREGGAMARGGAQGPRAPTALRPRPPPSPPDSPA
jgi:hypothetical protein